MEWFTQSTLVHPLTTIRHERLLPSAGEVVTRVGQDVSPAQIVARMPKEFNFHILPVSDMLGIEPVEVAQRILVKEGDAVEKGTLLLDRKGIFGRKLVSPVDGVLHRISNGRVVIQLSSDWLELRALMAARVVNQIPDRGVVLEAHGSLIQGLWSTNKENQGTLKVVTSTPASTIDEGDVNELDRNKILVGGKLARAATLQKAISCQMNGMIVGSLPAELVPAASRVPFPIIVTDGIGQQEMAEPIFELLKASEGKDATLFGRVGENGGRPKIAIPLPRIPKEDAPMGGRPLAIGQTVRILDGPYSSQIGTVETLFSRLKKSDINIRARGAEIRLQTNKVVFVPYVNLDVII